MSKAVFLLFLVGGIAAEAGEQEIPTGPASTARALELATTIENSRRTFTAELNAAHLSPEERAIRIERWQQEQTPLLKQASAARTAAIRHAAGGPAPDTVPSTPASVEKPTDPILADIHEIETGIRSFRKSLETGKLTPEQRAIQVEQFHQNNHQALVELENLKRQVALRNEPDEAFSNKGAKPEPSAGQSEIRRIQRDLAETDPEARAEYIEANASALAAITNPCRPRPENRSQIPTNQAPTDSNQKSAEP